MREIKINRKEMTQKKIMKEERRERESNRIKRGERMREEENKRTHTQRALKKYVTKEGITITRQDQDRNRRDKTQTRKATGA